MKQIEKVSSIPFQFIYFKPYSKELTSAGLQFVDTFAFHYHEFYEEADIDITPYNLKEEYSKNPYIGFDRFREFIRILNDKYKINTEDGFYYKDKVYDTYFAEVDKTGLHIFVHSR